MERIRLVTAQAAIRREQSEISGPRSAGVPRAPEARGEAWKLRRRSVRATLLRLRYHRDLRALRYVALFIGYPRSGHTLVAALLDAHPRMLFANGLDAALYLQLSLSVQSIAALAIWNGLRFTRKGRRSNGFDYTVPGGMHGRWERLDVVGDKSGDLLSARLAREPDLIEQVRERFGDRLRLIHVVRNPFDCIATMATRAHISPAAAAEEFLALCEANARARKAVPEDAWHNIALEALIASPHAALRELCSFLGEEAEPWYLERCARLVFASARESRWNVPWPTGLVDDIIARLRPFPFFAGYRFDSVAAQGAVARPQV